MLADSVADAVSYLHQVRSKDDLSVFDHLAGVVKKILEDKPMDPVDLLEASLLVKKTANMPSLSDPILPVKPDAAVLENTRSTLGLFGALSRDVDPETGEVKESEPPNEFECEDLTLHAHLMELVGCGLSKQEMYGTMLAMKKLGETVEYNLATCRFFGKILGTHADYYVFESTPKEVGEPSETAPGEVPTEHATGINTFTYFVCNTLGGPFTRLPDITPKQIKAARQLKKLMTGNVEAPVSAYPPFPGKEAEFLRAQIARIAHSTVLAPAGLFNYDEEAEEVTKAEEFEPKPAEELVSPESWVHRLPHIKLQGRCVVWKPEAEDEEEEKEPTEEEAEEGPEPLKEIQADNPVMGGPAWTAVPSSGSPGVKYRAVAMRSNLWPGAVAVAAGHDFANVYVGWAIKNAPFVPVPPPAVAFEYPQKLLESVELPPRVVPEPEGEGEEE